jgi:hypothetical protein
MSQSFEDSVDSKNTPGEEALEAALRAALHRRDCPDTMELVEYHTGLLAAPEQKRLQTHLTRCPHCRDELERLTESLDEDVPASIKGSGWVKTTLGIEWRRVREAGREAGKVIIRLLTEPLPPQPQLAPMAVRGRTEAEPGDVVRRIALGPDQVEDLDLEAAIRRSSDDPQLCTLTVRAAIPSRWPDLAGTQVQATAGDWGAEGVTDEEGEVTFAGLSVNSVDMLVIEVNP